MSNHAEIKDLQSLLNEILNDDRHEIYKNKIFQESSFENYGKSQFEKSFKLLKKVNELDFDIIDGGVITNIKSYVQEYKNLFEEAKSIDATDAGGDPETAAALIIAALIYAISFCNKNYHAEKHNETINAYKDRSLTTFSSFVEAAGDEAVRDQVLLQACAAIFANPATGFSKEQGLPLPPAAEVAKQVVRKVKD